MDKLVPGEGVAPSWIAKDRGFKSLKEFAELCGVNYKIAAQWYKSKPNYFMRRLEEVAEEYNIKKYT